MPVRNMGRFFVSEMILMNDAHMGARIFAGLVVLDCRHRYDKIGTEYLATGEMFDAIPEGEEAPWYEVLLDDAKGTVQFVREQNADTCEAAGGNNPNRP